MFDGSDTIVLYNELAIQGLLPVLWRPLPRPADGGDVLAFSDRNVRLLQESDAMEERGPTEKPDEDSPAVTELARLELKINLLLDLVGQILAGSRPRPSPVPVRFNAHGAQWRNPSGPLPEAGAEGVVEIYLHDCLAEPLRLPGRVTDVTSDGDITVRFQPVAESVADLIEKLAFRRHRRQVAASHQPRSGQ
jgi:hypothetical protein